MQQAPPESAFVGSQAPVSGSLQSRRSGGDPPQNMSKTFATRPKKRERNEAICDPVKHLRTEKSQSCADVRVESQKTEAPSLLGKDGGLCSVASVDRLVWIMTYEWNDSMQRPMDLIVSRTMLAKVVAATVELDCLVRFLKLGGLSVLDRWLQEVYMGRPHAEKDASVEGEGVIEDLVLAILSALERLPVDLVALKTCSIGRSVNNLRSHKHPDIHRRARKLVETWKRRVECEMKVSGDANCSLDHSVSPQKPIMGMGTLNTKDESRPEHMAVNDYTGTGRGKFASVTLLSSPESQSKAASTNILQACSVDTLNKSPLSSLKPSSDSSNGLPQGSKEGRAYTSASCSKEGRAVTSSPCVPGSCNNQSKLTRNTGSTSHNRSTGLSMSNTSSVATDMSGSVIVSKEHAKQGLVFDRSLQGVNFPTELCTAPCCSVFQESSDNALVYGPSGRSTLNSASSCVADCMEKSLQPAKHSKPRMCSEPVKTGIQSVASILASECSTVDVKSPDSPSVKSMCLQEVTTLATDIKVPAETVMKSHNYQLSKAGSSTQDRGHYDRNSSTVSSPSETSIHTNTSMCENKRAPALYKNIPSPADTASDTNLPPLESKDAGRKRGACISSALKELEKVQSPCEKIKRPCLKTNSITEVVGESSVSNKEDCEKRANSTERSTYGNVTGLKAAMERPPPLRCNEDATLEAARPVDVVEVEQEAENCKGISSKQASFERSSSCCNAVVVSKSVEAFTSQDSKQDYQRSASSLGNVPFSEMKGKARNSPLVALAGSAGGDVNTVEGSEVSASTTRKENKRPDFDLNERLGGGEELPIQPSGPFFKSWGPMQDFTLPASDAVPSLPIVPMAPIAVVAPAKGPFMLQAISCSRPPTGELRWKGSAATSAFRPTQPRTSLSKSNMPEQNTYGKTVLDFDLNIVAESPIVDKSENVYIGVRPSSVDAKVAASQVARGAIASSPLSRQVCEPVRAPLDLNQVDGAAAESGNKLDLDLNNGPIVQDYDDVVLAAKHIRLKDSLPSTNTTSNRLPLHPPILAPAFAMLNPDISHATGNAMHCMNGSHDGLSQFNIYMQSPNGFASSSVGSPQPSMGAGPFHGLTFPFPSTSVQNLCVSLGDTHGISQSAAVFPPLASTEPLVASQSKPSYIMGMLADVAHHQQGMGDFWNRPSFDLNAGPEGNDGSNVKDNRWQMFAMNEQMKARHQMGDKMAVSLREHEGCMGMSGSMQGVPMKQSIWH